VVRWGPAALGVSGLLAVLALAERTLIYGSDLGACSLADLVRGIPGERGGSGVGSTNLKRQLAQLAALGILERIRTTSAHGDPAITRYRLDWPALQRRFKALKRAMDPERMYQAAGDGLVDHHKKGTTGAVLSPPHKKGPRRLQGGR
jgi:hypothetical protein